MDDIRNDVFWQFCDVTKQNGCASVGTLYREPLGEVVVCYDSGCIIEKGAEVRHVQYNKIQKSVLLCAFKIFGLVSCQKSFRTCTASYCCYLEVPCLNHCNQHFLFTLCAKIFIDPTLALPFFQLWCNCGYLPLWCHHVVTKHDVHFI